MTNYLPRGHLMSNPSDPAASSGPAAAAPQRMRFAAFGDSLMWGQGVVGSA